MGVIKRPNLIFVGLVCIFVVVEILLLRPTNLQTGEEGANTGMFKSIDSMVKAQKENDEVGYTIDGFHYTAVEGEMKHWELDAKQAVLYEKSKLVRSQNAHIKMYDPSGKITLIEGDEADYKMGVRDLDLVGHVTVTFPDNLWVKTNRGHYEAATGNITSKEAVYGEADPEKGDHMSFWGTGFQANKLDPMVHIYAKSHVRMLRKINEELSDVYSDRARIDRSTKMAYFQMDKPDGYVESHQGTLYVRSRLQDAAYDSQAATVKYMTAHGDVYMKETKPKEGGLNYATSEEADFITQEDKIVLTGFPSAYQDRDTVTGEVITIFRKKDLVEVSEANAFHAAPQKPNAKQ